jgi:hypothetical protein
VPDLIDGFIAVVDSLRGQLYPLAGTRPYEVHIVKRKWPGEGREGRGTPTVLSDITIDPAPKIVYPDQTLAWTAIAGGREEMGDAVLTEVSLRYSYDEITGGDLSDGGENFVRVLDTKTGAQNDFTIAGEPWPDREETIGWIVPIKRAQVMEGT